MTYRYLNIRFDKEYSDKLNTEDVIKIVNGISGLVQTDKCQFENQKDFPWLVLSLIKCNEFGNYSIDKGEYFQKINLIELLFNDCDESFNTYFPIAKQIAETINWEVLDCDNEEIIIEKNLYPVNGKLLIEAILLFEKIAYDLINKLGQEYDLNLKDENPFGKLITRQNNLWKGSIKDGWSYQFHGDACEFINDKTNQTLDVKINRKGNYGAIDNHSLKRFIETTLDLTHIDREIKTSKDMWMATNQLEKEGIIIEIGTPYFPTRVLDKGRIKTLYNLVDG